MESEYERLRGLGVRFSRGPTKAGPVTVAAPDGEWFESSRAEHRRIDWAGGGSQLIFIRATTRAGTGV